ncbi:tyrosine-type recombinase/integrase [Spirochaeta cellobiosiphila]|uniref:tyrosine-type recombinase/integrase n=1 Tax=Spirochaeta cellobiosiphila TaxID=504483 RepID=UPI0004020B0E|nr:tyrosine-type recombinase/integrase [Spirochaeta cellobiosiphila]
MNDTEYKWLSIKDNYVPGIKKFIAFCKTRRLDLSSSSLIQFKQFLREQGYAVRTRNQYIAGVKKRLITLFEESDEALDNVKAFRFYEGIRKVKPDPINSKAINLSKILTPIERNRIILSSSLKASLFIEFITKTGLRVSEVCVQRQRRIEAIDEEHSLIRVDGKGAKERTVQVKTILINRIVRAFESKVFLFETSTGKAYTRQQVYKIVRRGARRKIGPHVCRHTFATEVLRQAPQARKALSLMLGHSSIKTTDDTYVHIDLPYTLLDNLYTQTEGLQNEP